MDAVNNEKSFPPPPHISMQNIAERIAEGIATLLKILNHRDSGIGNNFLLSTT